MWGKRKNNINAFTMLELIIVLTVVSMISLIMVIDVKNFQSNYYINQSIKKLGADFQMIQAQSIINSCSSQITLKTNQYDVTICGTHHKTEQLYQGVTMSSNFHAGLSTNEYGNLSYGAGTIKFYQKHHQKNMIFSIGAGRYRVEKP